MWIRYKTYNRLITSYENLFNAKEEQIKALYNQIDALTKLTTALKEHIIRLGGDKCL